MRFDVVVVGAGPAGATCALDLARSGSSVGLLDRVAPPRYKTCGGGIVGRTLSALDVDVGDSIERSLSRIELTYSEVGSAIAVERPRAPIVMTMRSTFDALLVEAARKAGARLLAPCAFRDLRRSASGWEVLTDRGRLEARIVVGADGAGSRVARSGGWGHCRRTVPAIESEIRVPDRVFEMFAGAARFDFGPVQDGYCWLFPKAGHLSVGCLTARRAFGRSNRAAPRLAASLDRYLAWLGITATIEREDHGFVIPVCPRGRRLGRRGVLLVGDAAGLADPLTCEGISNAVRSARLAARAVSESRHEAGPAAERYDHLLGRTILPELRWGRRLAPLLYGAPKLRNLVFRRAGDRLCEAFTDIFCGDLTYRGLLSRPSSYGGFLSAMMRSRGAA